MLSFLSMGSFNRDVRSGPRRDFGRRDFGRRSFDDRGGGREMHKAVCSNCGKDCEVPFRPSGEKPVYCSECFEKMGGGSERRFQDRGPRPDFERRSELGPQNNEQLISINRKLDKILEMLTVPPVVPTPVKIAPEPEIIPPAITINIPKKAKATKKKTPVKKE